MVSTERVSDATRDASLIINVAIKMIVVYPGITNSHLFVSTNQAQSHSYLFKLRHKMSPEKNMRKCDNAKRIGAGEK